MSFMILTLTEGKSRETFFGFRLPIFTSLHPNNPQGFPSTHLLPMHALLSPHEAMINLAVSSKVTFSFRSILSYPPHTPLPQHPLLSRFYLSKSGASPSSRVAVGKKAQSKNQRKHYDFSLLPSSLSNIISRHLSTSRSS